MPLSKYSRILLFLFFTIGTTYTSYCQYSKGAKKILELHKKDPGKALLKMEKYIHKKGTNKDWDLYVNMHLFRYRLTKDSLRNTEQAKVYFDDFIKICKEATLKARSIDASRYLVKYMIRKDRDNEVNDAAKRKLKVAENFFIQKKYVLAAEHYNDAIDLDPNYYRARLYLALCYMNLRRYEGAKFQFEELIRMYPTAIEPREYLVDAYLETKDYQVAFIKALHEIYIYPGVSGFSKMTHIMAEQNRGFNQHWSPRDYEVNIPGINQDGEYPEPWATYRNAKKEIEPYCNEYGIIEKDNDLTSADFMEVYAWEKMLENPKAVGPMFTYARKMKKRKCLECFIFISMFHFDLYPQYEVFIQKNKSKVRKYIEHELIK